MSEQASKPFSEDCKRYIAALDVDKDEQTLKAHGLYLRPECNRVRKVPEAPNRTYLVTIASPSWKKLGNIIRMTN